MKTTTLSRSQWRKTAYSGSSASNTEQHLERLLHKHGIVEYQWTQGRGPSGRMAMHLRFVLKEKPYRLTVETLDADAPVEELVLQAKRALFHFTKSALEMATTFFPPEQVLFAFLELPDKNGAPGATLWDAARPQLDGGKFNVAGLLGGGQTGRQT